MSQSLKIGVLAFHGDVSEHVRATEQAAAALKTSVTVSSVRTKTDAEGLDALIIPGGESTTLYKLCEREGMIPTLQKIPAIFGTCAGAIMLAKKINNPAPEQNSLGLMDITVERNAYGRQTESFETELETSFGSCPAIFIRAPRIAKTGKSINVLAEYNADIVACEERVDGKYYLALTFHPELTTSKFHEYFLGKVITLYRS